MIILWTAFSKKIIIILGRTKRQANVGTRFIVSKKTGATKGSFLDYCLLLFQNQYSWIPMNPTHQINFQPYHFGLLIWILNEYYSRSITKTKKNCLSVLPRLLIKAQILSYPMPHNYSLSQKKKKKKKPSGMFVVSFFSLEHN